MKLLPDSILLVMFSVLASSRTQYLDSVKGEVHAGNFSYYSLLHPGIVFLELISHSGDCDIYVSQFDKRPTFDLNRHCLQSSSCGVDKIIVPKSFKRPLAIGIYGYPSHDISSCLLNIYQINETEDEESWDELYISTKYRQYGKSELETDLGNQGATYKTFLAVFNFVVQFFRKCFEDFQANLFQLFVEALLIGV